MQKLKTNRLNTRYMSGKAENKQHLKEIHRTGKSDKENQKLLGNNDTDQPEDNNRDPNKKERRFKDWRTNEIALPL